MATLDLDQLSDYLDGENNEFGLDFAATHGFLCAVAVGPELSDWLGYLFDQNQNNFRIAVLAFLFITALALLFKVVQRLILLFNLNPMFLFP